MDSLIHDAGVLLDKLIVPSLNSTNDQFDGAIVLFNRSNVIFGIVEKIEKRRRPELWPNCELLAIQLTCATITGGSARGNR